MASSVAVGGGLVLQEDFDDVAAWTVTNPTPISVTGRTGTSAATSGTLAYTIPSTSESDTVTVGVAYRNNSLAVNAGILALRSDAGVTSHVTIVVLTTGAVEVRRGTSAGTTIAASATGVIAVSTWAYIELQAKLHDTTGFVTLRVNGSQVAAATPVDTKNAGTKTTFDNVFYSTASGTSSRIDDLYVVTGADGTFLGDQRVGAADYSVLHEPFTNLSAWTTAIGTPTIVAGRTGNAVRLLTTDAIQFSIPSGQRTYAFVAGFALNVATLPAGAVALFTGMNGGINTARLTLNATGQLQVGSTGLSAAGTIVAGVWSYIEVAAQHGGSGASAVTIRKDGNIVVGPVVDATLNATGSFNPAIFDTVELHGVHASGAMLVDDFYLRSGTVSTFEGDPACANLLAEPFNSFGNWDNNGATIVTGRNGTAAQTVGATNSAVYNIPSANRSDTLTAGFAWRFTDAATTTVHNVMRFFGDAGAVIQNSLVVTPDSAGAGRVTFHRGSSGGTVVGQNTTLAVFTQNTWYYIEVQVKLHDTAGFVIVRLNGTEVINATGLDTKNAGTATVYEQISVSFPASGCTNQFDDLYLSAGSGCSFQGDHAISSSKLIDEPFNNTAANNWSIGGAIPVAGRNGAGLSINGSTNNAAYSIVSGNQTDTLTVGFAWRYTDAFGTGQRDLMRFRSDAGATVHNTLAVIPAQNSGTTSTVGVMRGLGGDTPISTITTLPSFVQNTWYYFEVQIKLHDTVGSVIVRLNGTVIINVTNVDTKNLGTATVYDQIYVSPSVSGATGQYDDLYLYNTAATFEGDHAIGVAKILDEPFNDLARWTAESVTGGITTGRNGSGVQVTNAGDYYYGITSEQRSTLLTVGFAVRFASLSAVQRFFQFRIGTLPGTVDASLQLNTDGSLTALRSTSVALASSSVGVITAGTWAYVEASVLHSNAGGTFTVRVNGTQVIAFTGDTNNGFLDTDAYSAAVLVGTVSQTVTFDDLYLRNDATFEGDHAIP